MEEGGDAGHAPAAGAEVPPRADAAPRWHALRRPWLVALIAFVLTSLLGFAIDRSNAREQLREEREHARSALRPHADNLVAATGRRVAQISGLRAFVQSRRDYGALVREFNAFSAGLLGSGSLRAVQLVRDGRIVLIHPLVGNEAALALDLRNDSREDVRRDFLRASATDSVILSGPFGLIQGDSGLVVRQRVRTAFSATEHQVALVLDLRGLLAEVGLSEALPGFGMALYDRAGRRVAATANPVPRDPERIAVHLTDGDWELRGGPSAGWTAAHWTHVWPLRLAIVLITLLVTLVAAVVTGREARLSRAVELRTVSLRELLEEHRETIEAQRLAERAVASSEERLRLALAASRSVTFAIELPGGQMTWMEGGPSLLGLREAGETPDTVEQALRVVDPRDQAMVHAAFSEARRAPGQGAFEVRTMGVDGARRWLAVTWLSQAAADGVVCRLVGTFTDITARKELEEQFLHAQKMQALGALAGGVAHDFNNLLTVILGAGHLARLGVQKGAAPDEISGDLDAVITSGERASVLTAQLLAFSRRQVVQRRYFDASGLVGGMGSMLRRLVGEGIRVETALPVDAVPLFADPGQITQVVMNLAVNARDAMPDGGVLRIGLRVAGRPDGAPLPNESLHAERFAVLSVGDTGCGIDPAIRPRVFDPFFTTKPVGQGTGLGLSTVYGIVMQLEGTLRLSSEVGVGTTVDVYLPLATDATVSATPATAAPAVVETTGQTVLLAEDELGLRQVVERVLSRAGYRVIGAADGVAALAVANAHDGPIDLLVTDVVMPRLGGLELTSALLAKRPFLRVLFMSGYPQGAGQGTPVTLSDAQFIAKPFTPANLLAAVRRALAAD
ncbi:MAG: hypothetical protein C0497_07990 [Gemmatimonas sp.]|nr:hypothetical protein [Gemmatimonas sp.]